jgi:hypothetical protein
MELWKMWNMFKEGYCNPSLGLATKARACKGVGQEGSLGITFQAPGRVGECEGINFHTSKWAHILGVGLSNSQRATTKVKTHWIK